MIVLGLFQGSQRVQAAAKWKKMTNSVENILTL